MNLRLDENNVINNRLKIFYIAIIAVCVICIFVAIVLQIFQDEEPSSSGSTVVEKPSDLQTYAEDFENIFNNEVKYLSNNSYKIDKIDKNEEIIYTGYILKESEINKYDLKVNIPYINISNKEVDNYNKQIKDIFEKKAMNILNTVDTTTIYTVDYSAYISNNILSLVVRSTLKEDNNPQREIIQTYNYNLATQKKCSIDEILDLRGITKKQATSKIRDEIKDVQKKVEDLGALGYKVYNRDPDSDIYNINNATEYFLGADNVIYVIYAYGNENFTSEIDIVTM